MNTTTLDSAAAEAPHRSSTRTGRSVWWYLGRGLIWGVSGLVALAAVLVLVIPLFAGAQRYTIVGESMEPAIPLGSLVVVRPAAIEDIAIGSVVTFQITSGDPAVATHRVVGTGVSTDGEPLLVTQGDANSSADIEPVRAAQLRGAVMYTVPLLGWLNVLLSGDIRSWVVPGVAIALVVYAGWMFVSAWRDRRRRLAGEGAEPAELDVADETAEPLGQARG